MKFGGSDKSGWIKRQRREWRGGQGEHRRVMGFVVEAGRLVATHQPMRRDEASTATTFVPPVDAHGCNCISHNNSLLKRYPNLSSFLPSTCCDTCISLPNICKKILSILVASTRQSLQQLFFLLPPVNDDAWQFVLPWIVKS